MARCALIYDPALGELARELRRSVATGRMRWDDAVEAMKRAIRHALRTKAVFFDNSSLPS